MSYREYKTIYDDEDYCIYEGYFLNGKKDGYGEEYTYIDVESQNIYDKWETNREISTVYKGEFKDDYKHGEGTFISYYYYNSGSLNTKSSYIQEGSWVNGNFKGKKLSLDEYHENQRRQNFKDKYDFYKDM